MNKVTYDVPGISCGHCVSAIEMELGELEGIQSVKAHADTKVVEVEFRDPATEPAILNLLAEINYPASV